MKKDIWSTNNREQLEITASPGQKEKKKKRCGGEGGVEPNKRSQFCRWTNYTDREVNFYLKLQMLFNCKARLVFLQLLQSFDNVLNL